MLENFGGSKVNLEELGPARAFQLTCRGLSLVTLDTGPVFGILRQSGCDLQARLTENEFLRVICHISIRGLNAMRRGTKELATKWLSECRG